MQWTNGPIIVQTFYNDIDNILVLNKLTMILYITFIQYNKLVVELII